MEKFTKIKSIAADLPITNVDTDMIIPKQFLKTIKRTGLGSALFYEMRYDEKGAPIKNFVLNNAPYNKAKILISGKNFGCGSSREHAPWALLDFGIRCVIAESFADIFYNNCFKNGILAIKVDKEQLDKLITEINANEGARFVVDLENQQVITPAGNGFTFDIDPFRKGNLLSGLDDIGLTLKHADKISTYETQHKQTYPWLWA